MNDLQVAIQAALEGFQPKLWTALPAFVVPTEGGGSSFDPAKLTVSAQPTVQAQVRTPGGSWVNVTLPLCLDCPVMFQGGGGFVLTFPLDANDEGLLIFSARCIDAWWQQGGVQPQAELRMHDLSDGFFLPLCFSNSKVPTGVSTTTAQLRSVDGESYVELAGGHIVNIVAPGGVKVTGNMEVTGTLKADELETGEAGLNVAGNITATGNITASENVVATAGNVTATAGDVVASGGITLKTHLTSGVTAGAGTSGPPVP